MSIKRVVWTAQGDSGLAVDRFVNVWHFEYSPISADHSDVAEVVRDFYLSTQTNGHKLTDYMGSQLNGDWNIKIYDLADAEPRVPVYTVSDDTLDAAGSALPSEVAIALSFQGAIVSGSLPARHKGRLFIGPLSAGALSGTTPRPHADVMLTIAQAAAGVLADLSTIGADAHWVVWSPTAGAAYAVVGGYVDNAFDTQRRRGESATARVTF